MTADISVPKGHTLVVTEDGSHTFFSEAFQETCHSTSGAKAETVLHYVEGCRIPEKIYVHSPLVILEVGFGLGVGLLTTMEKITQGEIHFISLELDRNLLDWFNEHHPEFNFQWKENTLTGECRNFKVTVLQGNARETLPAWLEKNPVKWHAIYQDAFSPKKNPVLWTKEWFELLKTHSHEDVVLSTYSASSSIRKSLHETGWGIQKGEKFGIKRTSTRASLKEKTDPEILQLLERSPVASLTDFNIK